MKRILALALVAGLSTTLSAAHPHTPLQEAEASSLWTPPAEFAGPPNAALVYYRTWLVAPQEAWQAFKEGDTTVLGDLEGTITSLMLGAAIPRCDWGIQYDGGPWALLPHLSELRTSARLLKADADRLQEAGQIAAAADRIEAIFRMSGHMRRDRMIISSLVSAAISSTACDATAALLDTGEVAPDDAQRLLAAARLSADPFGAREAIHAEGVVFIGWCRETLTGPDAGQLMVEIAAMAGQGADSPLAKLNGEQLSKALDRLAPFYEQAVALFNEPDATEKLKALESRAQAGDFGPAAEVLAPSISRVRENVARQAEQRQAIIERLRQAANP